MGQGQLPEQVILLLVVATVGLLALGLAVVEVALRATFSAMGTMGAMGRLSILAALVEPDSLSQARLRKVLAEMEQRERLDWRLPLGMEVILAVVAVAAVLILAVLIRHG